MRMNYLQDPHTLVERQQRSLETTLQRAVGTGKGYLRKDSMVSVHLQQKKKGRQVVKINKKFRISQKRPGARQSPNSRKTQATALHLNVMAAQADATSQ